MTFFMRMCIKKTAVGTTQRVNHEGHAVYVMYKENGCAVSLVSDMEYPQRVAISILSRVMSEFTAMVAFNDWNSAMRDNTIVFPNAPGEPHVVPRPWHRQDRCNTEGPG